MYKTLISLFLAVLAPVCLMAEKTAYTLNIGEFSQLKVIDGINVDYHQSVDSAGMIMFESEPETVSLFMFSNDKSKLKIQLSADATPINTQHLPTVHVYSEFLNHAENNGDSLLRIVKLAPGAKFTAKIIGNGRLVVKDVYATEVDCSLDTGSGTIVIAGHCHTAKYNFTGTGQIQGDGLEAQDVRIRAFGTGSVGVWATNNLTVYGMGTSKIFYKGTPSIKNRAVNVKIAPIDQEPKSVQTQAQPQPQAQ